jgi:hypothetical protein
MGTMETQQDMEVLLALKEEEVASLRQQMAQLTADLKRNLDVSGISSSSHGSSSSNRSTAIASSS